MLIDEFVLDYRDAKDKKNIVQDHIVKRYIPYLTKVSLAEAIIKNSQYKATDEKDTPAVYRLDTPIRFMLTLMSAIFEYTDLEYDENDKQALVNGFDSLQESGALNDFLDDLQDDFTIFERVVQMAADDAYENETNLVSYLDKIIKDVADTTKELTDEVTKAIKTEAEKNEQGAES